MLERLLPDGDLQAGIYAQGFRFLEAFNMLGFLFAGLLLPMFSRMLRQGEDVGPLTGLALRLVLAGSLAVAVFGCVYARQVMELRYHEHTAESAPAFAVLIWCFTGTCVSYIFGTLLTASGDLRTLNKLAAGGMVLNIGLNLLLIPRHHALGAACTGLVTQVLMALAQMLVASRRYGLRAKVREVAGLALYFILVLGTALGLSAAGIALKQALPVTAVVALGAAFLTGLVSPRSLRAVLALREAG
jgi:O-antigen/teichoic acid export membrane protein